MNSFIKVFTILATILSNTNSQTITSCSSKDIIAQNLDLTLEPTQLKQGDPYSISVAFDLPEVITSGNMYLYDTFSGFPVVNDNVKLCDELAKNNIDCPLKTGFHNYTWNDVVPTGLPSGVLKGTEKWSTDDDREILCFEYTMKL